MAHTLQVDAARGHIGGHQHLDLAPAQGIHRFQAGVLPHVAVQGGAGKSAGIEALGEPVRSPLGGGKYDGLVHLRIGQKVREQGVLVLRAIHRVHVLGNGLVALPHGTEVNALGIFQQALANVHHLALQCGREEQGLPPPGQCRGNALHGFDEPHVQHAVRLIEHQEFQPGEVDQAARHVILQAARRGHQQVHPAAQHAFLGAIGQAADHGSRTQRGEARQLADHHLHLSGQFTGGRENQRPWPASFPGVRGQQPLQGRQHERRCLAGARLRGGHHITALQAQGNGLGLDHGWGVKPVLAQPPQQGLRQPHGREIRLGRGDGLTIGIVMLVFVAGGFVVGGFVAGGFVVGCLAVDGCFFLF